MKKCMNPEVETFAYQPKKHRGVKIASVIAAALVLAISGTIILPLLTASRHGFVIITAAETTDEEGLCLGSDLSVVIGSISPLMRTVTTLGDCPDHGVIHFTEQAYFEISVRGEDIRSITYSLNNGRFLTSAEYGADHGSVGSDPFNSVETPDGEDYRWYDTLTVNYDEQDRLETDTLEINSGSDEAKTVKRYGTLNIITGGDTADYRKQVIDRYWNESIHWSNSGLIHAEELDSMEEFCELCRSYYDEVFGNLELYVTVEYTDGSRETKTVVFSTECTLTTEEKDLLLYSIDKKNHTAAIVRRISEAQGIIFSGTPNYHLGEQRIDTDGDGEMDTVLTFTENDVVKAIEYHLDYAVLGKLK